MKAGKNQLSLFTDKALPNLKQWEYLVVLPTTENIAEDIQQLKEKVKTMSISCEALFSKAHITLDNFVHVNPDMALLLEKILSGQKKVVVNLTGQAIFQHGSKKTLYLKVENPEPIKLLHALLTRKSAKNFTPHLTIAKNITPEDFEKLAPFLSEFDYKHQWICDRVTILKRLHGAKNKKFELAAEIPLH